MHPCTNLSDCVLAQRPVLNAYLVNSVVVKHLSTFILNKWMWCFRDIWTFWFLPKTGCAEIFHCPALLSLWAEMSMGSCYQSHSVTIVLSSELHSMSPTDNNVQLSILARATSWAYSTCATALLCHLPSYLCSGDCSIQTLDRVKLERWSKQNAVRVTGDNTAGFACLHVNCCTCSLFVNTIRLLQLLDWLLRGSALWIAFGLKVSCPGA